MPEKHNPDGVIDVDILAWQQSLGETAFHLGTLEREYTMQEVFVAIDIAPRHLRELVEDHIGNPDLDLLDVPPNREGGTQVYRIGVITLDADDGTVVSTDFSEDVRGYGFLKKSESTSVDIRPVKEYAGD